MNAHVVVKHKANNFFGGNAPDNGTSFGNVMCHAAFVGSAGVSTDEDECESDEDEVPPPLLDDPRSDSYGEVNDDESEDDNNDDKDVAWVTDDVIAI